MRLADFFRIGFGQLPTSLAPVSKYGYKIILVPLLDDIKKLETEGIQVMFEGNQHHFFGTVSMLIADNLAAHAIGGYFCNFSTVHRFCRFYSYCKNQLEQCLPIKTFTLTKTGYENNIAALGTNAMSYTIMLHLAYHQILLITFLKVLLLTYSIKCRNTLCPIRVLDFGKF